VSSLLLKVLVSLAVTTQLGKLFHMSPTLLEKWYLHKSYLKWVLSNVKSLPRVTSMLDWVKIGATFYHIYHRVSCMFQSYLLLNICNAKLTCCMLSNDLCKVDFSTPVSFSLLFSEPFLMPLYLLFCMVTRQNNSYLN